MKANTIRLRKFFLKNTTLLLFVLCLGNSMAQSPVFTWLNGSSVFKQMGNYGTMGVSSSANIPGARENAMTWVDNNGMFWLFGGHGYSTISTEGYLNDLWKYDVSTNEWTWVAGSNTNNSHGTYGTMGVAASTNIPGARQNAYTWVDNNNNLWLFGGNGYAVGGGLNYLNDLWKYSITTGQWTWVSGSNTANSSATYGTVGVASANNIPGARYGGNTWKDSAGNLWLFGGQENHGSIERLNDLWKYNINTNEWTWVKGANTSNQTGIYGTKGVAADANTPGSRQASVCWTDNANNFWLFGGYGFPETGTTYSYLNDLWMYNVSLNQWTWVSGTNLLNQSATYGTLGVASANNIPGARQMSIGWTDDNDNLWLFGSWGYTAPQFGRMNDLWQFNTTTNNWTWYAGSNTPNQLGIYGTQGVSNTTNIAGARRMSVSFKSSTGDFYLFGGNGYDQLDSLGLLNDMWKISINQSVNTNNMEEEVSALKIYPNPFNNAVNIAYKDSQAHLVEIMDISGRTLYKTTFNAKTSIDLSKFSGAVFIVKVDNRVKKVIKQ
ncbi:MAG: kelch repeat-containing protein [Bacteroidia bacterium]